MDMGDSILKVEGLEVLYGRAVLAVADVSLDLQKGEVLALLGANGAGKSTTLKAITNILSLEGGAVRGGSISFLGRDVLNSTPDDLVKRGMFHVMEGRRVFGELSVEENLMVASGGCSGGSLTSKQAFDLVYGYFPRLHERRKGMAGYLSGGEQQMLAIGRALVAQPRLMLLDEPSLGLAPKLVEEIFAIISRINHEQGVSMLLVEQNAMMAFSVAHRACVLEMGKVVLEGPVTELIKRREIKELYLGVQSGGTRRGYRRGREQLV